MKHTILALVVFVAATAAAGAEKAKEASLSGDWTLSVEHLGLKLVLEQKKNVVTGTLDWPHGDPLALTGLFAGDSLVLTGDSTGANFTIHVDARGMRKPDGTLSGTLKAHFDEFNDAHEIARVRNQEIPWTAVRGLHDIVHFPR